MAGLHAAPKARDRRFLLAAGVTMSVAAAVALAATLLPSTKTSLRTSQKAPAPVAATPTTAAVPLRVTAVEPASGSTGVAGTTALTVHTTATVDLAAGAPTPTVSPAVGGAWSVTGTTLSFTPSGAWPPDTKVVVTVPAGLRTSTGATLPTATSWSFRTAPGSVLRLQQLLSTLGYLPLRWTPSTATDATPTADAAQRDVYSPPAGTFSWTWASIPPTLAAEWTPGAPSAMTKGAVMAFESDRHMAVDGIAGPQVWSQLLTATTPGSVAAPRSYTYALASKTLPQTLTVWQDGTVIAHSPANAGIPAAPTADGTFPVYERLATQTMRGTNPDGSRYADPVAWVAYFNGGDAIHYIARASYGSPQSLGCIEVPYAVGQTIWPHLTIGTLVTVAG